MIEMDYFYLYFSSFSLRRRSLSSFFKEEVDKDERDVLFIWEVESLLDRDALLLDSFLDIRRNTFFGRCFSKYLMNSSFLPKFIFLDFKIYNFQTFLQSYNLILISVLYQNFI